MNYFQLQIDNTEKYYTHDKAEQLKQLEHELVLIRDKITQIENEYLLFYFEKNNGINILKSIKFYELESFTTQHTFLTFLYGFPVFQLTVI